MKNIWKIYMLSVICFVLGTTQFIIAGILDEIAAYIGVTISTAGQLITAFSLANAIGTPIVMMLSAKMDQRNKILLALIIQLIGVISTLLLPGFGFFMVSRAILGVGCGVFVATAYSVAAKLAPTGREVSSMSNIALGFSTALVLGVPIGRVIAAAYNWMTIFWIIGILSILSIFAVAKLIPSIESGEPVGLRKQLTMFRKPMIAFALGITLLFFIGYSTVNSYIAPFLASFMPNDKQQISVVLFCIGIASMIGSKAGGFFADRIGSVRTIIIGMIIHATALAIISVFYGSLFITIPLIMIWAIAAWTFVPAQNYNLITLAPEASGIVLGLSNSFVQLGFALGAVAGGIAIKAASITVVTWVGAILVATTAITFAIARKR